MNTLLVHQGSLFLNLHVYPGQPFSKHRTPQIGPKPYPDSRFQKTVPPSPPPIRTLDSRFQLLGKPNRTPGHRTPCAAEFFNRTPGQPFSASLKIQSYPFCVPPFAPNGTVPLFAYPLPPKWVPYPLFRTPLFYRHILKFTPNIISIFIVCVPFLPEIDRTPQKTYPWTAKKRTPKISDRTPGQRKNVPP